MNLPLVGLFTRMLTIPLWFLVPAIAAVSAVGVYAVHSTTFDLLLMVGLGVFGYILRKMHFPMSPLILGFVLGEMLGRICVARCRLATASSASCGAAASRKRCWCWRSRYWRCRRCCA